MFSNEIRECKSLASDSVINRLAFYRASLLASESSDNLKVNAATPYIFDEDSGYCVFVALALRVVRTYYHFATTVPRCLNWIVDISPHDH